MEEYRQRNIILLIMITILIIYIAVPIYGVIRDAKHGETIFKIEGPISGTGEGNGLLDKIIDFFFESDEITVPVTYIVDLEGTVVYSDKTPYSNGLVELRSTPQYTRTTEDGYFIFRNVVTGNHTISVLDESGNTLAGCNIDISVGRNASSLGVVSFFRGTYTIHVPVNVEVLEIKIVLQTGEDGSVGGISGLEIVRVETTPPGQPEDPEGPEQPDGSEGLPEPEEPEQPDAGEGIPAGGGGGSSGGGETGGGPTPDPFSFGVYDSGNDASFGRTAAAQLNIFGTNKRIAPGMKGSYRFTVDNTQNSYRSLYTVDFTERDTLPAGSKIPMVFRLKAGSSYVAGDADTWCSINQLSQDTVIAGNRKLVYTLEWYWRPGENDNLYAGFSRDAEYSYTLKIEVTAQKE